MTNTRDLNEITLDSMIKHVRHRYPDFSIPRDCVPGLTWCSWTRASAWFANSAVKDCERSETGSGISLHTVGCRVEFDFPHLGPEHGSLAVQWPRCEV